MIGLNNSKPWLAIALCLLVGGCDGPQAGSVAEPLDKPEQLSLDL